MLDEISIFWKIFSDLASQGELALYLNTNKSHRYLMVPKPRDTINVSPAVSVQEKLGLYQKAYIRGPK